jgi:hypothetical protein
MGKTKHSKMGKRLIAAMKEVVDHVEGRTALPKQVVRRQGKGKRLIAKVRPRSAAPRAVA